MTFTSLTRTLPFAILAGTLLALTAGCDTHEIGGADAAQAGPSANARLDKVNLKRGAVYSMSNAPDGNAVVAFSRAPDGTLTEAGSFDTGGTGSNGFEDTANGLVLGNAQGESSPNNLIGAANLLFATNAGSNDVTVFEVEKDGLERVELQDSGGEKPVSITVNGGVAYVLNSGETEDGLNPPNCTTGELPTVTGFRVSNGGQLDPIPNSTRQLSGDSFSGCAQVSFSPDGDVLVVTERTAVQPGEENNEAPAGDEGVIVTFTVEGDGTLGTKRVIDATGQGPFGFTFSKQGNLLTTEQFDGPAGPREGAAAAYAVNDDGTLTATSPSVENGGTDTCWFVLTDNGKLGFTTSFFNPTPRISSYRVTPQDGLELIEAEAADVEQGAADIALNRNSKYLYQLNAFNGTINAFEVGRDGSLTRIQQVQAHEPSATAARIGIAAS